MPAALAALAAAISPSAQISLRNAVGEIAIGMEIFWPSTVVLVSRVPTPART